MKPQPPNPPHQDHQKYIEGIRNNDRSIFEEIYQIDMSAHVGWVMRNGGTNEDGQDNFHDAIEVIIRKIFDPSFILFYPFKLYLHGVCRKLWYKKLRKKGEEKLMLAELVRKTKKEEYINMEKFEKLIEDTIDGDCWEKLKERTFQKISPLCQQLLTLDKEGKEVEEISKTLDMTPNAIYRRRSACKKSWREEMEKDPEFKKCNPYNL